MKRFLISSVIVLSCCVSAIAANISYKNMTITVFELSGTAQIINGYGTSGNVVIPATVPYNGVNYKLTSIYEEAFSDNTKITGVSVEGENLTEVGEMAFCNCSALASISLPNSVTTIGNKAFAYTAITSIVLPENVKSMGTGLFYNCSSLESVTLPKSITRIPNETFYDCSSIKTLDIPEGITVIGESAFVRCGALTKVKLPSTLVTIEKMCFYLCSNIKEINFPKSLRTLGEYALYEIGVPYLLLPEGLTNIGSSALHNIKSAQSIVIPSTVTRLYEYVFSGVTEMKNVYLRAPQVITLNSSSAQPFVSIRTKVRMFAPEDLIEQYKDTSVWSWFKYYYADIKGDANGDQVLDVSDVNAEINLLLGKDTGEFAAGSDVNRDCAIDISDVNETINLLLGK